MSSGGASERGQRRKVIAAVGDMLAEIAVILLSALGAARVCHYAQIWFRAVGLHSQVPFPDPRSWILGLLSWGRGVYIVEPVLCTILYSALGS